MEALVDLAVRKGHNAVAQTLLSQGPQYLNRHKAAPAVAAIDRGSSGEKASASATGGGTRTGVGGGGKAGEPAVRMNGKKNKARKAGAVGIPAAEEASSRSGVDAVPGRSDAWSAGPKVCSRRAPLFSKGLTICCWYILRFRSWSTAVCPIHPCCFQSLLLSFHQAGNQQKEGQ